MRLARVRRCTSPRARLQLPEQGNLPLSSPHMMYTLPALRSKPGRAHDQVEARHGAGGCGPKGPTPTIHPPCSSLDRHNSLICYAIGVGRARGVLGRDEGMVRGNAGIHTGAHTGAN